MKTKPVCIIPARGGSKRIPRKNVIDFNGKPMIAWSIATARESGLFDQIIVTTDDEEIASIACDHGAVTPFMREADLADDFATTAQVMIDALERIEPYASACCLYPTAPLATADDLRAAYDMQVKQNANCVASVTEFDFHPYRAFQCSEEGQLTFEKPEHELTRSQDLPNLVHDAGMFYFLDVKSLLKSGKMFNGKILGFEISRLRAIDIDTLEDLEIAKILHKQQMENGSLLK